MKAQEVIEITRRAKYSRIARQMSNFEFENKVIRVTVSENAPCCIQKDGTTTKKQGWVEIEGELKHARNPYTESEVWIKTATLGGRRRQWVRCLF